MSEPLRVCQIVDQLSTGGAEWLVATAAAQGTATGIDHRVISLSADTDTPVADALRRSAVPVVALPSDRSQELIDLARFRRLVSTIERHRPDVVHLHLEMATMLGVVAARRLGLPTAVTLHGTQPEMGTRSRLKQPLLDRAIGAADTVIAVGPTVAREWSARIDGLDPLVLVNPVPPRIAPRSRPTRPPRLITVGRLVQAKSFPTLVEAMALVHRAEPAVDLRIVGEGPERPAIQAAIDEAGLGSVVSLLGSRNDVDELLASADVFVGSSVVEGMPLAVLEAMAAGLPIVATSVGDLPSTVPPEAGQLVPAGQPEQLAAALLRVIRDADLRHRSGEAATRYVAEHHHPDVWGRELAAIYRSLTSGRERVAS